MSLGELVVELGIKGNIKPLQDAINKTKQLTEKEKELAQTKAKVAQQIDKGIRAFRNITASITASIWAINKLSDALLNNNQHWINLLRQSNITLESFQKYGQVANILDRSLGIENATQSLQSLEQQLYKLQLTGEGASGFLLAGINPMGKSTEQVIEDIRSRISGMDDRQATFLLNQMGIDPRMLGMLRLSRQELEAINNELKNYRLTEEQRNALQEYNKQLEIARAKLKFYKDKLIIAIIPYLTKLTNITAKLVGRLMQFIPVIKRIVVTASILWGIPALLKAITVGIGAIKTALIALASNPALIGWTAMFSALYLIVDDIMTWLEGGESLFGYFLGAIDNIVEDERTPQWLKDLLYIVTHADAIKKAVSDIKEKFNEDHPVLNEGVKSVGENKWNLINPLTYFDMLSSAGKRTGEKLANSIVQHITIYTNQPAQDIKRQLELTQQTAH